MIDIAIKVVRPAIVLFSIVGLCFSGSFSVMQILPAVQAAAPAVSLVAGSPAQSEELNTKMAQLSSSNRPEDVATLAYIWGFPLVTMERQFHFMTSPNVPPGVGRGPSNANNCARELMNASFTNVVSPNSDTLYCQTQFDLKKEPVVLVVPTIADR
jgi:hypothetical protein